MTSPPIRRVEAGAPRVHVQKLIEHRTHEFRLFPLRKRLEVFQHGVVRFHQIRFQIAALGQIALGGAHEVFRFIALIAHQDWVLSVPAKPLQVIMNIDQL